MVVDTFSSFQEVGSFQVLWCLQPDISRPLCPRMGAPERSTTILSVLWLTMPIAKVGEQIKRSITLVPIEETSVGSFVLVYYLQSFLAVVLAPIEFSHFHL